MVIENDTAVRQNLTSRVFPPKSQSSRARERRQPVLMAERRAHRPKLGLETLFTHTSASLERLYHSRWVCQAVFAQLSGPARAVVLRLLCTDCSEAKLRCAGVVFG
eukprot:scaffold7761_cov286-Pinguiococcus_pyrenoidosus.AAC.2